MSNSQRKLNFKICDTAVDGSNDENVFHFEGNVQAKFTREGGGERWQNGQSVVPEKLEQVN
jgi:hypothetical protein